MTFLILQFLEVNKNCFIAKCFENILIETLTNCHPQISSPVILCYNYVRNVFVGYNWMILILEEVFSKLVNLTTNAFFSANCKFYQFQPLITKLDLLPTKVSNLILKLTSFSNWPFKVFIVGLSLVLKVHSFFCTFSNHSFSLSRFDELIEGWKTLQLDFYNDNWKVGD